jgi:hypothetical protein
LNCLSTIHFDSAKGNAAESSCFYSLTHTRFVSDAYLKLLFCFGMHDLGDLVRSLEMVAGETYGTEGS